MDDQVCNSNIYKLVSKSHQYTNQLSKFFINTKTQVGIQQTQDLSPRVQKSDCIKSTDAAQLNTILNINSPKEKKVIVPSSNYKNIRNQITPQTFMINLASQQLDQLPSNWLSPDQQFQDIQLLDLQDNRLRNFPIVIIKLSGLKVLNINNNFIKNLPSEIYYGFPRMNHLMASNNLISQLHVSIQRWSQHLTYLDLSHNRIENIYPIMQLKGLQTLMIQSNDFRIIPYGLSNLKELKELGLDWFKYVQPTMNLIQKNEIIINKLRDFLLMMQRQKYEDPSVIDISDDESLEAEGIRFTQFVLFFSDSASVLPVYQQANPQDSHQIPQLQLQTQATNILHKASVEQDIGVVITLIKDYPYLINQQDPNGYTPLGLAIKEEKYFSAKTLIFNGADVNRDKIHYGSVLNLAIVKGQIHMINDLIHHYADVQCTDQNGNSALHYCMAVFDRDPDVYNKVLNLLIKSGSDLNQKNKDGWSPLHLAVKKGSIQAIMSAKNHNDNARENKNTFYFDLKGGKKGNTLLHISSLNCNFSISLALLQCLANPFIENGDNKIASELCPHNYRQYKLIKSFEYQLIKQVIKGRKNVICKTLHDDVNDSREEQELQQEMNENIQVFEGLQHKTLTVSKSLWIDVLGGKEVASSQNDQRKSSLYQISQVIILEKIKLDIRNQRVNQLEQTNIKIIYLIVFKELNLKHLNKKHPQMIK